MNERVSNKKATNTKLQGKNIVLIAGLIYTLISVLAVISYVSKMNSISNTPVTLGSVMSSVWWQIFMIILFAVTYILYNKKQVLGSLLELVMGLAMLVYIVITVAMMGVNILALLIELIYPLILICHGFFEFKKSSKKSKRKTSTV